MHSGTARGAEENHGLSLIRCSLNRSRNFLANDRSHARAEETKVHDADNDWVVTNFTRPRHNGIFQIGSLLVFFDLCTVVEELEWIDRLQSVVKFLPLAAGCPVSCERHLQLALPNVRDLETETERRDLARQTPRIFAQPLFREVRGIGINGGEPTLRNFPAGIAFGENGGEVHQVFQMNVSFIACVDFVDNAARIGQCDVAPFQKHRSGCLPIDCQSGVACPLLNDF